MAAIRGVQSSQRWVPGLLMEAIFPVKAIDTKEVPLRR